MSATKLNYQNPQFSIAERVADLLGRMTLDEKLAQLGSAWVYELLSDSQFAPDKARALMQHGIGQITRIVAAALFSRIWVPIGNTGGANVSAMRPMPIPADLRDVLDRETRKP